MAGKIKQLMVIGLALLALGAAAFGLADVAAGKNRNQDPEGTSGRFVSAVAPWASGPFDGPEGDGPARTMGRSIRGTGEFFRTR